MSHTINTPSSTPHHRAWTPLASHAVLIARDDIDTDQIIPARFLTTTSRVGLGRHLFADWRYDDTGATRPGFPLSTNEAAGAAILVAGRNFGCGSSREHAPWALGDWGVRAVIASSFADIFRSNAHRNGVLTIALDDATLVSLHSTLANDPSARISVDLASQTVTLPTGDVASFTIDPFSKRCLLEGLDELGVLLAETTTIEQWEATWSR